jgi:UDP-N-acetylglucosamine 2-epimerase (non-hydrolysing)
MKIAVIQSEMARVGMDYQLVHTDQHYDFWMSDVFLRDLGIQPSYHLNVHSGTHAEQTGKVMVEFEKLLLRATPELVLVVGDVNSTMACAITAKKMGIKVAHVEAGCRSGDMTMPEEINRIVTDSVSDYFFAIDEAAVTNLKREGKVENVYLVGDTMIDAAKLVKEADSPYSDYCVFTLHRSSNVDDPETRHYCLQILHKVQEQIQVIFPIHPRLAQFEEDVRAIKAMKNVLVEKPFGYKDFINLVRGAKFVLTDSGSLQAETTFLQVPCLTMRDTTERPNTLTHGTNRLVKNSKTLVLMAINDILNDKFPIRNEIPLYDGMASKRIVEVLN